MKIAIVGNRTIDKFNFTYDDFCKKIEFVNRLEIYDTIISGGATGIDSFAKKYAIDESTTEQSATGKYAAEKYATEDYATENMLLESMLQKNMLPKHMLPERLLLENLLPKLCHRIFTTEKHATEKPATGTWAPAKSATGDPLLENRYWGSTTEKSAAGKSAHGY